MALRIFQPRINLLRGASRFHAARPGVLVLRAIKWRPEETATPPEGTDPK